MSKFFFRLVGFAMAKIVLKRFKKLVVKNQSCNGYLFKNSIKSKLYAQIFFLQRSINNKKYEESYSIAKAISCCYYHGSYFIYLIKKPIVDLLFIILVILFFKFCFIENCQIPSASMRPTFKEKNNVIVLKTAYSFCNPITSNNILFDKSALNYGSLVAFSSKNLSHMKDTEKFLGVFSKYRLILKRAFAYPGDKVYFYGGDVYVLKGNGELNIINSDIINGLNLDKFNYFWVPFIKFTGLMETEKNFNTLNCNYLHFNKIIGSFSEYKAFNNSTSKILIRTNNKMEFSSIANRELFGKYFGIENYGITKVEFYNNKYYLTIYHNPYMSLSSNEVDMHSMDNVNLNKKVSPGLKCFQSRLEISDDELTKIFSTLYTSRFRVINELIYFYDLINSKRFISTSIRLKGVSDGVYEIYSGIAFKVSMHGILSLLSSDNAIYNFQNLLTLFNYGINFSNDSLNSARYVYYKHGDLYVSGSKIYDKENLVLNSFIKEETEKSNKYKNLYYPFIDNMLWRASPEDYIFKYGFLVKDKSVFVLGDNTSISFDSRFFGSILYDNLRGTIIYKIWPFGDFIVDHLVNINILYVFISIFFLILSLFLLYMYSYFI